MSKTESCGYALYGPPAACTCGEHYLTPAAQAVLEAAVTWQEAQQAWTDAHPALKGTANSLWDESYPPMAAVLAAEPALLDAIRAYREEQKV